MKLIPCRLSQMLIEERSDSQIIFIKEVDGERRVPINIGPLEALAIDRAIKKQQFPRPLTHDLLLQIAEAIGGTFIAVRIIDFQNGTFFGELMVTDSNGKEHSIDCRPSDAIALLVRLDDVPLYVADHVLDEILESGSAEGRESGR